MFEKYNAQVSLLVKVLPYIAKEECFALKGGIASINSYAVTVTFPQYSSSRSLS